jgi:hypothetical protein
MRVGLKSSVRFGERKHTTWFAMGVWHALSVVLANRPLIVTSANDSKHMTGSKHYTDDAFDARVRHLTADQRRQIVQWGRKILDPLGYDIVSFDSPNPKEASRHKDHDHVEYDPKPGESLTEIVE